jgi:hypothetical protein
MVFAIVGREVGGCGVSKYFAVDALERVSLRVTLVVAVETLRGFLFGVELPMLCKTKPLVGGGARSVARSRSS